MAEAEFYLKVADSNHDWLGIFPMANLGIRVSDQTGQSISLIHMPPNKKDGGVYRRYETFTTFKGFKTSAIIGCNIDGQLSLKVGESPVKLEDLDKLIRDKILQTKFVANTTAEEVLSKASALTPPQEFATNGDAKFMDTICALPEVQQLHKNGRPAANRARR